jgi:integrase
LGARHGGGAERTFEVGFAGAYLARLDFAGGFVLARIARGFARHLATVDPASEVPSKDLLPATRPRIAPYIYTDGEIAALMAAAGELRPRLRAARHQTLIGLLMLMVQIGVRVSELVGLCVCDIHLGNGAHIRVTGKGRKPWPARRAPVPDGKDDRSPLHGRRGHLEVSRRGSRQLPIADGQAGHPARALNGSHLLGLRGSRRDTAISSILTRTTSSPWRRKSASSRRVT